MGRCEYAPVSTIKSIGFTSKYLSLELDPDIDYCVCGGQGSTMIDAMDGCNTERICPNQLAFVTHTWPAVTQSDCRHTRGLPRLPWFESCNIATGTFTSTADDGHAIMSSRVTFCTCNKVSETASSYVLSTVSGCKGIYMCHNMVGFVEPESKTSKRMLERATTATAAGPVLAVTTDATPGSVPTTEAEPTISMAE
jgi:hypothetical protein